MSDSTIETLKKKMDLAQKEVNLISGILTYLEASGISTNGNGLKDEPSSCIGDSSSICKSDDFTVPPGYVRINRYGSSYLRRKRRFFKKPLEKKSSRKK